MFEIVVNYSIKQGKENLKRDFEKKSKNSGEQVFIEYGFEKVTQLGFAILLLGN